MPATITVVKTNELGEVVSETTRYVEASAPKFSYWRLDIRNAPDMILRMGTPGRSAVTAYAIGHMDYTNNQFVGTYRELSEYTGLPKASLDRAMVELQELNLIKRVRNGTWMLNPYYIAYGNQPEIDMMCVYYDSLKSFRSKERRKHNENTGSENR